MGVLSYARDYRQIAHLCNHGDWICWQVFLFETKGESAVVIQGPERRRLIVLPNVRGGEKIEQVRDRSHFFYYHSPA